MVERNFAEKLSLSPADAAAVNPMNREHGVEWLISFLRTDRKKTYCLYEASTTEEIREAAKRAGVPADVVIEGGELRSSGTEGGVQKECFAAT